LYRFGGEEFLVLAQCRTVEAAAQTAERIVSAVRAAPAPLPDGGMLPLTVTAGLAEVREDDTLTAVVERADAALYQGKQAGRDRWVIAGH
jgi:diguanylate cyclase (GGDEF)-like protein